jgi:hypothetical protein
MSVLSQLRWIFASVSDEEFALSQLQQACLRHLPTDEEIGVARSLVDAATFIAETHAVSFEEAFGRLLITIAKKQAKEEGALTTALVVP